MRAARTHGTNSLAASLQAAKPAVSQSPGQDSFKSRWQSALNAPAGSAGLAQRQASDKAKALRDGDAAEATANAAKAAAAKKSSAANDAAAQAKAKAKQALKSTSDSTADAKTVDGVGSGAAAVGVPVNGAPGGVQPVQGAKKESADANAPGINSASNSASTSTLQQAALPPDVATTQVEMAAAKQMETSALESKTKRVAVSSIAGLSEKPTAGAVGADGLPVGLGASGMAVGGVGGQAMQGGHSGSSGHNGQSTPSQPAAGTGPQLVASSPSQLDVGVYDDTHGWLRIRAELGAGGAVNATLTSADAAHESLKTALPEMTHYLGAESVNVNSIALDKFGDTGGGQPGSHAEGQQQGSTTGQHTSGDEQQQAGAQANAMAMLDDAASRSVAAAPDAPGGTEVEAVGAVGAVAGASTTEAVGEAATASAVAATSELTGDAQTTDVLGAQVLPWQVGVGGSGGWVNVSA
jgi:hypothetical protein